MKKDVKQMAQESADRFVIHIAESEKKNDKKNAYIAGFLQGYSKSKAEKENDKCKRRIYMKKYYMENCERIKEYNLHRYYQNQEEIKKKQLERYYKKKEENETK